jgi:hypothetical protein
VQSGYCCWYSTHYSPTISIAEIIYEMQVGVFFTCKCVTHFDFNHSAKQHSHTSLESV